MRQSAVKSWIFTGIGIVFVAIMLFPVYWMLNGSLQAGGNTLSGAWIPLPPNFSAYQQAISEQGANLLTSLVISLGAVVITIVIAAPAAYALAKFKLRGVGIVLLALLIAQMIPGIVIANALYTEYNSIGLINSFPGLILADASNSIPFAILIIRAFMLSIPPSLIEAARVDGAGHFRAFFSVALPISRNSIITAALFSFLFTWSDFIFALTLTTGNSIKPVTLGIYSYLGGQVADWGPVMATSVLAAIPAIALLVFAQRYIAAGALGGAVK
jgi:multiple sugar transport system permease protein